MKKAVSTKKTKRTVKKTRKVISKKTRQLKEIKELSSLPVLNIKGQTIEQVQLDKKIFDGIINKPVLYQAINMYRANRRLGCASTKERGQVRGGGRKPWRQKGTGRARAGSIRSPLWRGGGVVFGPHPRSYSYNIPEKVRHLAIKSSINAKLNDNELIILDDLKLDEPKTKKMYDILKAIKTVDSCLLIINQYDAILKRASRNIPGIKLETVSDLNAYDILSHKIIVMTKKAFDSLQKVLSKC